MRCYRSVGVGLAVGAVLTLSGCEDLLDVDLPGATTAGALDDPAFAALLTLSAQAEFECAFSNYAWSSGVISGELVGGSSAGGAVIWQKRDITGSSSDYASGSCGGAGPLYAPLAVARALADDVVKRLNEWTDADVEGRGGMLGTANLYAGYSYMVFADGMCSTAYDLGPEVLPAQSFQLAKDRFTSAIQTGDTEIKNAGNVGLARAHLSLGENQAALAAAKLVPEGFRMDVTRSGSVAERRNDIFWENNRGRSVTVDPHFWDEEWMGVADPRVSLKDQNSTTTDGQSIWWTQTKYTSESSPIRLASYLEAQLIIAEVEGGQIAVDIINKLHTVNGLPPFVGGSDQEIRDHVIDERRREFFLEGRRLGDLRHYGGFAEWAHGTHPFVGVLFPGIECFPMSNIEKFNNPNISG